MSDDLRKRVMDAITDVWDHSAQIDHATDSVMEMIEADRAPREIPASVRAALDRMCTPLDDSWIKRESYTVKTDMWCMAVIRAHIEGKPLAMPPCATCSGRGIIGGPTYDNPGEGGVPCPDCSDDESTLDRVRDAVAEALGDAYDCTRVWGAWGYGTMGSDDFSRVADDSDRVDEIARAALAAIRGTKCE